MKRITIATAALVSLALAGSACGAGPGTDTTATATPAAPSPTATVAGSASPRSPGPSGSPAPTETSPATPTPGATPGRTTTAAPGETSPPTGTDRVSVTRAPEHPPIVQGARFARHDGFDRVVIDLQGARTGYTVDWVRKLYEDGSGKPVDVNGGAYLQVTLKPANAHTEDGEITFGRKPVLRPGLPNLATVVRTGDFEGVVTIALVLRHRAGFRVSEQSDPTRLIVDIAH
ncbi:hypothetical protein ACFFWE_37420 [Sphaerisporangium melleum]|nr:hypothetical protein [Sphaerisporangium melleum]